MTLPHELPGERALWETILKVIRELMEGALTKAGIRSGDIRWTEMRWDVPDITASWPSERPDRNIHAWIRGGGWPTYFLEVEGAAWVDDYAKLQRRLRFFSFPDRQGRPAGVITVSGLAANPDVTVVNKNELGDGLEKLAKELQNARLDNGGRTYPLQADPRRSNRP